jgi:hypothetical protein
MAPSWPYRPGIPRKAREEDVNDPGRPGTSTTVRAIEARRLSGSCRQATRERADGAAQRAADVRISIGVIVEA